VLEAGLQTLAAPRRSAHLLEAAPCKRPPPAVGLEGPARKLPRLVEEVACPRQANRAGISQTSFVGPLPLLHAVISNPGADELNIPASVTGTLRRQARGKYREKQYGEWRILKELSIGFLQANAVRNGTAFNYEVELTAFLGWLEENNMNPGSVEALDTAVNEYFEHMFFLGYQHDKGEKLLASIGHFTQKFGKKGCLLVSAHRALKGWRRLTPGRSRSPVPYPMLMLLVNSALFLNMPLLAVAMYIHFHCYLRPGELVKLKSSAISKAVLNKRATYALILAEEVITNPTNTQELNDSLTLDTVTAPWLGQLLDGLRARPSGQPLWPFNGTQYQVLLERCAELAGLQHMGVHAYGLRHGGASWDTYTKARSLAEVKARGRWLADTSVRRCQKEGRVVRELERMGEGTIAEASIVEAQLAEMMLGRLPPRRPLTFQSGRLCR